MLLHHRFIESAKKYGNKMAIVDRTLNRRVTYSKALVGSLILLLIFMMLIIWALNVAYRCRDPFGTILSVGITAMIFWQVFNKL